VVRTGFASGNDWQVISLRVDKHGATFRVEGPHADFAGEYRLNLLGRHQVANALFAIALGAELGLTHHQIETGRRSADR
jgi:UDP-N-acetylmuramoyl-tripeptide--D-alanyl-D-alanine ligase